MQRLTQKVWPYCQHRFGEYFFNTGANQLVTDVDGNGLIPPSDLIINLIEITGLPSANMAMNVTVAALELTLSLQAMAQILSP